MLAQTIAAELKKNMLNPYELNFYSVATETNIKVINLKEIGSSVRIVYGIAFYSKVNGFADLLNTCGIADEDCNMRNSIIVSGEEEWHYGASEINSFFDKWLPKNKNEILAYIKDKRKAFINILHRELKPLGFKKNSNIWTRTLFDDYYIKFHAQKSSFSDRYYFRLYIENASSGIFYTQMGDDIIDWQLIPQSEFEELFHSFLKKNIIPITEINNKEQLEKIKTS